MLSPASTGQRVSMSRVTCTRGASVRDAAFHRHSGRLATTQPLRPPPVHASRHAHDRARPCRLPRSSVSAATVQEPAFAYDKVWYPAMPVALLDKSKPHAVTILNKSLVIYYDAPNDSWRCFEDACPHRGAPLSEGKPLQDGRLQCSYHGWKFDGQGACSSIPQASSKDKEEAICGNVRSCARSYPTRTVQGCVWVYPSRDGLVDGEPGIEPPICPMIDSRDEKELTYIMRPFFRDLPYDFSTLLENVADPAHVPFSHHGVQGNRESVKYGMFDMEKNAEAHWGGMDMDNDEDNFHFTVGGRHSMFLKDIGFHAPHLVRYSYAQGDGMSDFTSFNVFAVPTTPGHSRLVSYIATTRKLPLFVRIFLKMPEFLDHCLVRNRVLDGDNVFLHFQEHNTLDKLLNEGKTWGEIYYSPTTSDLLLGKIREWLGAKGSPYDGSRGLGGMSATRPQLITDHRVLLNRFDQHTKNCLKCLRALKVVKALKMLTGCGSLIAFGAMCALWVSSVAGVSLAALSTTGGVTALQTMARPGLAGSVLALSWKLLRDLEQKFYFVGYAHHTR